VVGVGVGVGVGVVVVIAVAGDDDVVVEDIYDRLFGVVDQPSASA
jgi:hypothetical protein